MGTRDLIIYTLSVYYKTLGTAALSMKWTDQVNPGESYDPLLAAPVKSTSISADEGKETG